MPPQAASAQKILALTVAVVAQTGGQGGISRAPTLRPQGAVTVANLPAAQAETNRAAHQARRAPARQDRRVRRDHRARLMAVRLRPRRYLREAVLLIRGACARLSCWRSQVPTSLEHGRCTPYGWYRLLPPTSSDARLGSWRLWIQQSLSLASWIPQGPMSAST